MIERVKQPGELSPPVLKDPPYALTHGHAETEPTLPAKRLTVEERAIWAYTFQWYIGAQHSVHHAAERARRAVEEYRVAFLQLCEADRCSDLSTAEMVTEMQCAPYRGRPGGEPSKPGAFGGPTSFGENYERLAMELGLANAELKRLRESCAPELLKERTDELATVKEELKQLRESSGVSAFAECTKRRDGLLEELRGIRACVATVVDMGITPSLPNAVASLVERYRRTTEQLAAIRKTLA